MPADLLVANSPLILTMQARAGDTLGAITSGAVAVTDGRIAWVGPLSEAPMAREVLDASGAVVVPGLVDCHTHTVWAGSRSSEFERRLAGESYTTILEDGGGILSTVRATRAATEAELVATASARLAAMRARGVLTVEVKSGYGLDVDTEVRMLRSALAAGLRADVDVIPTFLGAHAIPPEHRADRERYVRHVIDEQLPAMIGLARAIDVYVDRGAFTLDEGRRILEAGRAAGLAVKAHAEQVAYTGIAEVAASLGALSCDHLERVDDAGIAALARAGTVAVLSPGAMLYLHDSPPPIAAMRAAGVRFAVATDLNPGSSPVHDLWACATLACVTMGLTVAEALRGVTVEGAAALGLDDRGRIAVGLRADLVLVEPPAGEPFAPASLVQHLGGVRIRRVLRAGVNG